MYTYGLRIAVWFPARVTRAETRQLCKEINISDYAATYRPELDYLINEPNKKRKRDSMYQYIVEYFNLDKTLVQLNSMKEICEKYGCKLTWTTCVDDEEVFDKIEKKICTSNDSSGACPT